MKSLKQIAYQRIKENIVTCRYTPGSFLSELDLMAELDMSRTPIREAFSKLEQEGLVEILSKRGVQVCRLTMQDINQTFEARLLLEPFIVEHYIARMDVSALAQIRAETQVLLQNISGEADTSIRMQSASLDDRLHRLICSACPNRYFQSILAHIYDQSERIRMLLGPNSRVGGTLSEHLCLIDCLLVGDAAGARQAASTHLLRSKDAALRSLSNGDISFGGYR